MQNQKLALARTAILNGYPVMFTVVGKSEEASIEIVAQYELLPYEAWSHFEAGWSTIDIYSMVYMTLFDALSHTNAEYSNPPKDTVWRGICAVGLCRN